MKILEHNENTSCTKTLKIEILRHEVNEELDGVYKEFISSAVVPGFRKGRVTRRVAEMRYGRDLYKEAVQKAMESAFKQAVEELKVKPVASPRLEEVKDEEEKISETRPIVFEARFEYMPELETVHYQDIQIEPGSAEVSEKEVVNVLNRLREENAVFRTIDDRGVADGDFVTIATKATVENEPFDEATHNEIVVQVGTGRYIAGFEEQLRDMKVNEEKSFTLPLPNDHPVEKHRGKEATFAVTVKQVQERQLPPLDDEFAKDMGNFSDLSDLKTRIRENLARDLAQRRRQEMREAMRKELLERNHFDVPTSLVLHRYQYLQRLADADLRQSGSSLVAASRQDEGLLARYEKRAEDDVRISIILRRIAEMDSIELSDAEFTEYIQHASQTHGADPVWFLKKIKDSGLEAHFHDEALETKVLNLLLARFVPPDEPTGETAGEKTGEAPGETEPDKDG